MIKTSQWWRNGERIGIGTKWRHIKSARMRVRTQIVSHNFCIIRNICANISVIPTAPIALYSIVVDATENKERAIIGEGWGVGAWSGTEKSHTHTHKQWDGCVTQHGISGTCGTTATRTPTNDMLGYRRNEFVYGWGSNIVCTPCFDSCRSLAHNFARSVVDRCVLRADCGRGQ